ncbi:hypothetical protein [Micromonospora orduensis]|uniref:hypothetical protein n=1 Tax=Micromonospora orduensis TaxID=1420891 RepID=UPI00142E99D0|nr:hypothetical protein [Micromonospora orduensis]
MSTQLFDLRSRSANICCVIDRRTRQPATRRPIGNSSLLTPPPPIRDRTSRVIDGHALRLGLIQLALARAERALDRIGADTGPRWVSYFSPAHLAGAAVRCLGDLRLYSQALRHAPDALTLGSQNTRTRALHTALVAMTHARAGDTDAACIWGRKLAHHAAGIQSTRVQQRIHELTTTLSSQQVSPQVNEVLHTLAAGPAAT